MGERKEKEGNSDEWILKEGNVLFNDVSTHFI